MKLLIVIKEFLANPLILVLLTIITMVLLLTSCMAYPEGQRPTTYKPAVTRYNITTGEIETIFDMGGGMSFSDKGNIYQDMPGPMSFDIKGNTYIDMGSGMSFDAKGNIYIDFD